MPSAAGSVTTKKYPKKIGKNHCIIWFICACWALAAVVAPTRPLEMRCWSHMAANTAMPSGAVPFSARSIPKKSVLSGTACRMNSTS